MSDERDALAECVQKLLWRLKNNLSASVLISGEPGTGKSTLAMNIGAMAGYLTGEEWPWKKAIAYSGEQYLTSLKMLPEYSTVILNEAGEDLFNRDWQQKIAKAISRSQQNDRVYRKIKLFVVPYAAMIDVNIVRTAHYRMHCSTLGARRLVEVWEAMPAPVFQKLNKPYYVQIIRGYAFAKMPERVYTEYLKLDYGMKERMNEKYRRQVATG